MELRQLEAFVAIAHAGSFTRAAEKMNLTQPSLSARIQQLEEVLGGALFERRSRPVRLTAMGQIFLPYAERVLGILETGQEALDAARKGLAGRLAVGTPVSVATYLMPAVVDRFSRQFPQAELYIETSHSSTLVQQLEDGRLDLVFTAVLPQLIRQFDIILRIADEMVITAAPEHPLARERGFPLADLWQHRVLLPRWGGTFETYIRSLRELADQPWPLVNAPLTVARHMLARPDIIAFVPRRFATAIGSVVLDVPEFHYPWDVVLITRPGRSLTPLETRFLETARAAARSPV